MRTSLPMRAVCASAAVTLFLSLGFQAAFAHGSASFGRPAMRPGVVHGHGATGWRNGGRSSWAWRGWNRGNRWSRDGWFWNWGGLYGGGFWPYAFADTGGGAGGDAPLVVVGAPTLNLYPAAAAGGFEGESERGCVKLRSAEARKR
jgi:hypothetical protein